MQQRVLLDDIHRCLSYEFRNSDSRKPLAQVHGSVFDGESGEFRKHGADGVKVVQNLGRALVPTRNIVLISMQFHQLTFHMGVIRSIERRKTTVSSACRGNAESVRKLHFANRTFGDTRLEYCFPLAVAAAAGAAIARNPVRGNFVNKAARINEGNEDGASQAEKLEDKSRRGTTKDQSAT